MYEISVVGDRVYDVVCYAGFVIGLLYSIRSSGVVGIVEELIYSFEDDVKVVIKGVLL